MGFITLTFREPISNMIQKIQINIASIVCFYEDAYGGTAMTLNNNSVIHAIEEPEEVCEQISDVFMGAMPC